MEKKTTTTHTHTHAQDEFGYDRWFKGGKLNSSYLMLDAHIKQGRGSQTALICKHFSWLFVLICLCFVVCFVCCAGDSPVSKSKRSYTFSQLRDEVAKFAGVMKQKFGVTKGWVFVLVVCCARSLFSLLFVANRV